MRKTKIFILILLCSLGTVLFVNSQFHQATDQTSSRSTLPVLTAVSQITSANDCFLCGNNGHNLKPNDSSNADIGLLGLNSFTCIDLSDFTDDQTSTLTGPFLDSNELSILRNYSRKYTNVEVKYNGSSLIDYTGLSQKFCQDCLNKVLALDNNPLNIERHRSLVLIDYRTLELYPVNPEHLQYFIQDYVVNVTYIEQRNIMRLLVFYAPALD